MKITRLSRSSWFKIKVDNKVIHFDPGYTGFLENQGTPSFELEEKADWVFISHSHLDHYRLDILEKITNEQTKIIAPFVVEKQIKGDKILINDHSKLDWDGLKAQSVPAYNTPTGHSTKKYHQQGEFVGYLLEVGNKKLYFAGDTDLLPEMETFKNIDIAFLPIGGTYVMDQEEALCAIHLIQPKTVILMHEANQDPLLLIKKVGLPIQVILLTVGATHVEN